MSKLSAPFTPTPEMERYLAEVVRLALGENPARYTRAAKVEERLDLEKGTWNGWALRHGRPFTDWWRRSYLIEIAEVVPELYTTAIRRFNGTESSPDHAPLYLEKLLKRFDPEYLERRQLDVGDATLAKLIELADLEQDA